MKTQTQKNLCLLVAGILFMILILILYKSYFPPNLEEFKNRQLKKATLCTIKHLYEKADTGDLLFMSGTGLGENLLKNAMNFPFSHVAMIIKENDDIYLWEADMGQRKKDGARLINMKDKLKYYKGNKIVAWKPMKEGTPRPDAKKLSECVKKYSSLGMEKTFLRWFAADSPDSFVYKFLASFEKNNTFCSELIAKTLIDMELQSPQKHPASLGPNDYYYSNGRRATDIKFSDKYCLGEKIFFIYI